MADMSGAAAVERFQEGDLVELAAETPEAHDFGDGYGRGPFIVKQVIPRAELKRVFGSHAFPEESAETFFILADEKERVLGQGGLPAVFPTHLFRKAEESAVV